MTLEAANRPTMLTETKARRLADLPAVQADALLALIALAAADPRTDKIDVGVGVYRDGDGNTPILKVMKEAEKRLLDSQKTKSYLGGAGDKKYTELVGAILLGDLAADKRIAGVQTPGGCGALRLGFQLIAQLNPAAKVLVGMPTWPNHEPIIDGVGLKFVEYAYYDRATGAVKFDVMLEALENAAPGDVALLHGCCHNPTGADLDDQQWDKVIEVIARRGLLPLVDIAYQGFARGLDEDARGLRALLEACDEVMIAQSCDKNFSVYRDRVGSFWIKTGNEETTKTAMAHSLQNAREMWSMPPDHGAAAVRIILEDEELRARWLVELEAMCERINKVRQRLASADRRLAFIADQFGMFSMLPLTKEQVLRMRSDHGIYMADSGRFNVVGMADHDVDQFIAAVVEALDE